MSANALRARALPVLALLLGAIDTVLARLDNSHRPRELSLFLHATLLWAVFLLLAWVPAALASWLTSWRSRRRAGEAPGARRAPLGPALWLLYFAIAPVAAHDVLDRYTALGANLVRLHAWGPWLEALGVLVALGVVLVVAAKALARAPRRPLAAGLVALSVATGAFIPFGGGGAVPTESEAGRPNLLLLIWDTARARSVQPFGADRETTPELARLADEALVYTNARSASRFTFTSHLSMLTGAYPSHHGARLLDTHYRRDRAEHVAALLRQAGYRTGGFVGTDVLNGRTGIDFGFEVWDDRVDPPVCETRAWKLVHDVQSLLAHFIEPLRLNGRPHWIQDFQRPAEGPLAGALAWIRNGDPRPWFCLINLYDVHWPYLPDEEALARLARPYDGLMDGFAFRSDSYPEGYVPDEADQRHLIDLYEAELWELDRKVDAFLSELELDRGDTAVVLTSDHGEAFGEGGVYQHDDVREPQLRIPLLVLHAGPDPPHGHVDLPAAGVDIAPTLLGLAGLDAPDQMDGLDLSRSTPDPDRAVLIEDRDHVDAADVRLVLVRGRFRLEVWGLGEDRSVLLQDLESDPVGEFDVGDEHPEERAELLALLDAMRASWGGDAADAETPTGLGFQADALSGLGYAGQEGPPDDEDGDEPGSVDTTPLQRP